MAEFTWSEEVDRYRNARGRFVPVERVRAALDVTLDGAAERMRLVTRQVAAGELSLPAWQTRMMAEIKQSHVAAGVAMRGGTAQMSQADYGAIGQKVRAQYQYVRGFADDLAKGVITPAQAEARAELYAQAARHTGRAMEARLARRGGMALERNVLGAADHCHAGTSCIGETRRGWQPLGTLAPPGSRACKARCHCHLVYKAAPVEERQAA